MSGPSENDSADFIDQARWLLEWHDRRSEAFTVRAVAVMGFVGVVLALLVQGAGLKGIKPTEWTWLFLGGSLITLALAGIFAVLTLAPHRNVAPSVNQLRSWWKDHANAPVLGTGGPNIAESLLNSRDLSAESAVSSAKAEADKRGKRFTIAFRFMVCSFVFLSLLFANILCHTWGK